MPDSHPFSLGLLVGRFQMLHLGHQYMIDTALAVCDRVGVLVGSSQESGTAVNPFPWELRRDMLRELYGNRIEIAPLPDIGVGNTSTWGDYVLEKARSSFEATPDLVISGAEERRISWFHHHDQTVRSESGSRHIASSGLHALDRSAGTKDLSADAEDLSVGNTFSQDFLGAASHKINAPAELYLPKVIDISASRLRTFLIENDFAAWSEFTDPRLHARFPELRALVLDGEAHKETGSL